MKAPKLSFIIIGVIVVAAFAAIAASIYYLSQPVIPASVDNELDFKALLPTGGQSDGYTLDRSTAKYDKSIKVLSFVVRGKGNKVTLSEQTYPEILIFDKLVGPLHQYSEVQTKAGKFELTRPDKTGNKQTAVSNANNLLIFATTDKDFTDDQWVQFFADWSVEQ